MSCELPWNLCCVGCKRQKPLCMLSSTHFHSAPKRNKIIFWHCIIQGWRTFQLPTPISPREHSLWVSDEGSQNPTVARGPQVPHLRCKTDPNQTVSQRNPCHNWSTGAEETTTVNNSLPNKTIKNLLRFFSFYRSNFFVLLNIMTQSTFSTSSLSWHQKSSSPSLPLPP